MTLKLAKTRKAKKKKKEKEKKMELMFAIQQKQVKAKLPAENADI